VLDELDEALLHRLRVLGLNGLEGAASEANKWMVIWDDGLGACWPMGRDEDCEGALCVTLSGKVMMFRSRAAAHKAIKVSKAYAKLRQAQGLPTNYDFLDKNSNVKIIECEEGAET